MKGDRPPTFNSHKAPWVGLDGELEDGSGWVENHVQSEVREVSRSVSEHGPRQGLFIRALLWGWIYRDDAAVTTIRLSDHSKHSSAT